MELALFIKLCGSPLDFFESDQFSPRTPTPKTLAHAVKPSLESS